MSKKKVKARITSRLEESKTFLKDLDKVSDKDIELEEVEDLLDDHRDEDDEDEQKYDYA
jgi:hypothetical protein